MPPVLPPNQAIVTLAIGGGYSTEFGPRSPVRPDDTGRLTVPYLVQADNLEFTTDGWPYKMRGAARVNAVATGATDSILGVFDYWRQGTSGSPVQKRVIHAGTVIYKDDADGVWDSLLTGLEAGEMPWYAVMNDNLIIASTSNTDVPQSYNQTSIANLGGTPPNFAFFAEHKDRLWAAGAVAAPSRLYYSALGNPADWTGAGSGSIDVYSDDGDQITALRSHKDELLIWKGPYRGAMYRLIGSSPTGALGFALIPFVRGVGCTSQQSVIPVRDDLLWWDHNGIHSLKATAAFGDYAQGFVSSTIASDFRDALNHSRLDQVWGQSYAAGSLALWTTPTGSSTTNNLVLMLDLRFEPPRFVRWPAYAVGSIGIVVDGAFGRIPWYGTHTGFVLRGNSSTKTVSESTYAYRWKTPYVTVGDPFFDFGVERCRVALQPRDESSATLTYERDAATPQTATISQGSAATLAPSVNPFTLDTDVLGGAGVVHDFPVLDGGSFKDIRLSLEEITADFEIHELALLVTNRGLGATTTVG